MEVHKHPHHVLHKKKWNEYLPEFFMLFLAVFLGFVSESWREHVVESNKEKEYMHSLLSDLKTDTAIINRTVKYNNAVYRSDSVLLTLLQVPDKDSQTLHKLYQRNVIAQNFYTQINDSKTFDQLKSTGDYRLIKSKRVLDSIAKYYQSISMVTLFRDEIQNNLVTTYNLSFKIFDDYSFDKNIDPYFFNKNTHAVATPLIANDTRLLKEYSSNIYHLASGYKVFNSYLENIKSQSVNLISLINKEYP